MLIFGFGLLTLSNAILTLTNSVPLIFLATFVLGAQIGVSHSNLMACLAETTPAPLRGTVFGVYHFFSGIGIFVGTSAVGYFWEVFSHSHGFGFSVFVVFLSILMAPLLLPKPTKGTQSLGS